MAKESKEDKDELTEEEIERRRDEALKRALSTPPKPHKVRPPKVPDDGRNGADA